MTVQSKRKSIDRLLYLVTTHGDAEELSYDCAICQEISKLKKELTN